MYNQNGDETNYNSFTWFCSEEQRCLEKIMSFGVDDYFL